MNSINLENRTEFWADRNSWEFIQEMVHTMAAIASISGKHLILSGCMANGSNISKGYIIINGEILPIDAGIAGGNAKVTIVENKESVNWEGNTLENLYIRRKATFGTGALENTYNWADFSRITLDSLLTAINSHKGEKLNPHRVTAAQVGLGSVNNTSDLAKPVSTATQAAINAHATNKSNPHGVTKSQVGLGNADNTSDAAKPMSTATQAAINAHATNKSNPHGVTRLQVGLGNADNTSDVAKPVSTATQTALNLKADKTHTHKSRETEGVISGGNFTPLTGNSLLEVQEGSNVNTNRAFTVVTTCGFVKIKNNSSASSSYPSEINLTLGKDNMGDRYSDADCILVYDKTADKQIPAKVTSLNPLKIAFSVLFAAKTTKEFIINAVIPLRS